MHVQVSYRAKLLASHAAVALIVSGITLLIVDRVVTSRMEEQVDSRLEGHARAIPTWFDRSGHPNRLAARLAEVVGARVTYVDQDGQALGESQEDAADLGTLAPEVMSARKGETGRATRYSEIEKQKVRYIAVPGPDSSVIRLGLPIGQVTEATEEIRSRILMGALVSFILAMILAVIVARALTNRLRKATAMAQRLGRGEWDIQGPSNPTDEVGVLSQTIASAAAELKLSDQQRRELLSNLAHEIRTPVTSIRGYAETLAKGGADEETQREFLQTIHRNSLRIGHLVEDLLELEALEGGTGRRLDSESVRLADVVKLAISTLRVRIESSSATIHDEVDHKAFARADAEAIERILLNLLGNALSYGGEGVTIDISAKLEAELVTLTVRDDGPGVATETAHRLFERFYRGEIGRGRDKGGSGLGLAIARQLAQSMGGSLYVVRPPVAGSGLTIALELPRASA